MNYTERYHGLNAQQVQKRISQGEENIRFENGTKTVKEIVKSNLFTYFNMVFIILGILLIIAGAFRDLTFLLVIAANAGIGIFQELRSKSVLDKMNLMTEPKVTVIRDSQMEEIRSTQIVLSDLIVVKGGMQVPADAKVLSGSVHVNESILTGESDEIEKRPGAELLAGSIVISGECLAQVSAVSDKTYAAKLTLEATTMDSKEESEILRSLNKMLRFFGVLIIPLGIILFIEQYRYANLSFSTSISSTVAALIGMIPEGIYLTTTIALAVSAMKLAANKVLVHDLKCIETLSRVDVLCVDKTGTITEKEMRVVRFEVLAPDVFDQDIEELLADYAAASTDTNDTMQAVRQRFTKGLGRVATDVCAFSSRYKYSAVRMDGENYVFGAPEYVLGSKISLYQETLDGHASMGRRVLALAKYPYFPNGESLSAQGDESSVRPLAFVILENPVREGAPSTFSYFGSQGVEVKVISGDNPVTVSSVAAQAGIPNADQYVDVSTIPTDGALYAAATKYTVFGRVSPDQKKKLVKALQRAGKKVAMTGDGVNDIIAMKQADCSVAMASGAEAASQAAQLVLMDSDFANMPSVVDEGRRVVNNIERAASLYLVKNIFSLLLAVFSVILMLNYPLNPSQITLISIFTIGVPSLILALEPNHSPIRGRFMHNVLIKSLPAGFTDFLVVSALVIFARVFELDADSLSTSCSIILAIVGFMILFKIINLDRKSHVIMMLGVVAGWIVAMIGFPSFFGVTAISGRCFMLLVVFAITTEPILRYFSMTADRLDGRVSRLRERFGR